MNLICVTGPTASGKTSFAAHLAYCLDGEIISADSRQVYRRMDIGTGKDYQDYIVQNTSIPVHLTDIREPGYIYNLFEFQQDFRNAFTLISGKGKIPILAGGTGLYIQSAIQGYSIAPVPANPAFREEMEKKSLEELTKILQALNPSLHNTTDLLNKKRTIRAIEIAKQEHFQQTPPAINPVIPLIFGILFDLPSRRKRITERLQDRLRSGMIEEVQALLKTISTEDLIFYGLEYKYVTLYLTGKMDYDEMYSRLEIAIHQFAKRQMTWFRQMEKKGHVIHWIDGRLDMKGKIEFALDLIKKNGGENLIKRIW